MKGYQKNSNKPATWESDLKEAHELEDTYSQMLQEVFKENATIIQAPKDESFTPWDIKMIVQDEDFTFEIKQDKNVHWSGNVAVEVARTVQGQYRPTGITSTEADMFVYFFNKTFYMIHTRDLKQLISKCHIVRGGDGGRAHIALVPKQQFLSKAIDFKTLIND